MKKGILILSSAALIGFTTSCGGGGDKVKELKAEVDSLEQRMQFVTDSLTNSWQAKLDSAVQATKRQMRAAMSSSGEGGSSSKKQETSTSRSKKKQKMSGDRSNKETREAKKSKMSGDRSKEQSREEKKSKMDRN